MESHNLALCVSPNLFHLEEDDKSFCSKNKQRIQVVKDLISIAREIGVSLLCHRTSALLLIRTVHSLSLETTYTVFYASFLQS